MFVMFALSLLISNFYVKDILMCSLHLNVLFLKLLVFPLSQGLHPVEITSVLSWVQDQRKQATKGFFFLKFLRQFFVGFDKLSRAQPLLNLVGQRVS